MNKFKKRRVRLVDNETTTTIVTDTRVESYGDGDHICVNVQLTDCSRSILWHEFGDTEKEAQAKVDQVIDAMLELKTDIKLAWATQKAIKEK